MVTARYCCRVAEGVHREVVQLPHACLTQDVASVRAATAQLLGLSAPDIELVFRGRTMDDSRSLTSYHVMSSSVLHVLRRPQPVTAPVVRPVTKSDALQLSLAMKDAAASPYCRNVVARVGRPETMSRLEASVPGLADDSGAVALLQEPALLLQLVDADVARRVLERHPCLMSATSLLAEIFKERTPPYTQASQLPSQPMDVGYDAGGDSEDDVSEGAAPAQEPARVPYVTRQLLATALQAAFSGSRPSSSTSRTAAGSSNSAVDGATAAAGGAESGSVTDSGATSDTAASGGAISQAVSSAPISSELVSAALREALSLVPTPSPGGPPPPASQQQPPPQQAPPASVQVSEVAVRQLLDFGITDNEALIRQALLASNGNLDEAVQFIYSSL